MRQSPLDRASKETGKNRKLRRRRLSEELAHQIKKDIIDQGLKPGDSLPTEEEIGKRYGVSRPVVREATKALDFLGIVNTSPRRGIVLEEFDFNRATDYFGFHFALSNYPKIKILQARAVIETGALYYTKQAMQKDPTIYDRLRAIAEEPKSGEGFDDLVEHDIAFHRALIEASNIPPLAAFCDLLQVFFRVFREELLHLESFEGGRQGHILLLDTLRSGDLNAAIEQLRLHLSYYETQGTDPQSGAAENRGRGAKKVQAKRGRK
jgi:GntR family transcriptional regulator, transcriptional repressor for pyruvate dehydrogenase complex